METIKWALKFFGDQLRGHSQSARLDAEILLAFVRQQERSYLYANDDQELTPAQCKWLQLLVNERLRGMPIAYLTGIREFWSLPLRVSKDTLIPRPETELLVELSLQLLARQDKVSVLDLGTGCGAIALALAHARPAWRISACDQSKKALDLAKINAAELGLTNITFYHSNWFSKIHKKLRFDAIVANPPYIATNDPHLQHKELSFEPASALISGKDGSAALECIIRQSLAKLSEHGLLLLEHGFKQKELVCGLLKAHRYANINCWQDWQGNDRVSGGIKVSRAVPSKSPGQY